MSAAIAEGTRIRVTEHSVSGDAEIDESAGVVGEEYDVCYLVPAKAKGNDDPTGRAYLMLDEQGSYGGSHWAYPEHVEVVMTAEQKATRVPPVVEKVRDGVSRALHSMDAPIDVDETSHDAPGLIGVSGTTDDGLRVQFWVRIEGIAAWE